MSSPPPAAHPDALTPDPAAQGSLQDVVIRLAGNSQDGIQSIGGFLARLAGRSAQDVMTYMTIPSTISGGASIFQVHLGSGEVLSPGDEADFLIAFYQHSLDNHIASLRDGGVCIYDSDHCEPDTSDKRVTYVGVPFTSATVEAIGGSARDKGKNMFVLGQLVRVFHLDKQKLVEIIERTFGRKSEDILRNAMLAFDAGYAYEIGDVASGQFSIQSGDDDGHDRIATDGNQMMVSGLLAAGVRYGSGYPITPWSTIMETLRVELPKYGGLFVQAEDELAAVSMAIGMGYSGHLAVTGSSGPGLSLKMEALGYATMAEIPLIVINVQRGGPSTGLPTSVEQSDLMQAIYGSHGDTPRAVLAPQDVEDCFYIAVEACRIAKTYSMPVIILSDQALATRIEAFREPDLDEWVEEPDLDLSERPDDYVPYPANGLTQHAPPGTKMAGGKYPVMSGLEHDEWGHPSSNPEQHAMMNARRRDKLVILADELATPEVHGAQEGEVLLIGWGSTYGPLRETVNRAGDRAIGHLHLRHIHPLPPGMEDIFAKYKKILVVEMNDRGVYGHGQLATLLRSRYCDPKITSLAKTDGLTFKIREVLAGIESISPSA